MPKTALDLLPRSLVGVIVDGPCGVLVNHALHLGGVDRHGTVPAGPRCDGQYGIDLAVQDVGSDYITRRLDRHSALDRQLNHTLKGFQLSHQLPGGLSGNSDLDRVVHRPPILCAPDTASGPD